jgi:hypothetical protein
MQCLKKTYLSQFRRRMQQGRQKYRCLMTLASATRETVLRGCTQSPPQKCSERGVELSHLSWLQMTLRQTRMTPTMTLMAPWLISMAAAGDVVDVVLQPQPPLAWLRPPATLRGLLQHPPLVLV